MLYKFDVMMIRMIIQKTKIATLDLTFVANQIDRFHMNWAHVLIIQHFSLATNRHECVESQRLCRQMNLVVAIIAIRNITLHTKVLGLGCRAFFTRLFVVIIGFGLAKLLFPIAEILSSGLAVFKQAIQVVIVLVLFLRPCLFAGT